MDGLAGTATGADLEAVTLRRGTLVPECTFRNLLTTEEPEALLDSILTFNK